VFLPPKAHADCLVQLYPTHEVLKGSFSQARVEYRSTDMFSIHLGGVSVWFDKGLERGTLSTSSTPVLSFVSGLVEIWGEEQEAVGL
jgi:hypothetical protein